MYEAFPSCKESWACFKSANISVMNRCLNGYTHGPVHIMIGGEWGHDMGAAGTHTPPQSQQSIMEHATQDQVQTASSRGVQQTMLHGPALMGMTPSPYPNPNPNP